MPEWHPGAAVAVVIAAEGYPTAPARGDKIFFTERTVASAAGHGDETRDSCCSSEVKPGIHSVVAAAAHAYVLHAGTARDASGDLVSAGGRVLNVVGSGRDVAAARAAAYELAGTIEMRGGWYRRDIAADRE